MPAPRNTVASIIGSDFLINGHRTCEGRNHLLATVSRYASWGFFDCRRKGEEFGVGYQGMPTCWGIDTDRKRAFFETIRRMSGT